MKVVVGEVSKEVFNLAEKLTEMVKFLQKIHEYLIEVDKIFINLLRRKETKPTMIEVECVYPNYQEVSHERLLIPFIITKQFFRLKKAI